MTALQRAQAHEARWAVAPEKLTTFVLRPSSLAAVSGTKISHAMPGDVLVQLTIPQSPVCRHFPPFSPKSIIAKTSHIVVPPFFGSPSPRASRPHMLGHSLEFSHCHCELFGPPTCMHSRNVARPRPLTPQHRVSPLNMICLRSCCFCHPRASADERYPTFVSQPSGADNLSEHVPVNCSDLTQLRRSHGPTLACPQQSNLPPQHPKDATVALC